MKRLIIDELEEGGHVFTRMGAWLGVIAYVVFIFIIAATFL